MPSDPSRGASDRLSASSSPPSPRRQSSHPRPQQNPSTAVDISAPASPLPPPPPVPPTTSATTTTTTPTTATTASAPSSLPSPTNLSTTRLPAPHRHPPYASSTSSSSSPARPGLLSRLGLGLGLGLWLPLQLPLPLPLRSRNRHLVDFHIRCDEPYRKYNAGDSVRGSVVLVVIKPLRITHLVVSLHGYVRVLKDPTSATKAQLATTLPPAGSSKRPRYYGNGFASLFHDEQVLSGEGRIEPGKYEFGFDLAFPDGELPGSIDFERGTISYMITATLTRPTTIAPTTTCDRKVMLAQKIDIGLLSPPRSRTIFLEPISKRNRRKRSAVLDKSPTSAPNSAVLPVATISSSTPTTTTTTTATTTPIEGANELASEPGSPERPSPASAPAESESSSPDHGHAVDQGARPQVPSDGRSEASGGSGRSISTILSRADLAQLSQAGSATVSAARQQALDDKTITATIELLRGGGLPGDTVSVRVTVQHIKRVKSMTGVIVTLFRQGKIDFSPSSAMFTNLRRDEARRAGWEEAFPRSRTGIGGLSLSSTSSTSVFRKDLDQNATPLIIDPSTLQASVTVSVRIPDDAFPTIKGVPGDMISFKYQVEVIVDLGGRLSSQIQGGNSSSTRHVPYASLGSSDPQASSYSPLRGANNIADTAQLRREKGVISMSMETVVGTSDSSRRRRAARGVDRPSRRSRVLQIDGEEDDDDNGGGGDDNNNNDDDDQEEEENGEGGGAAANDDDYDNDDGLNDHEDADDEGDERPARPHLVLASRAGAVGAGSLSGGLFSPQRGALVDRSVAPTTRPAPSSAHATPSPLGCEPVRDRPEEVVPLYVPPPQTRDPGAMSEKERIREAERRLLPSRPIAETALPAPGEAGGGGTDGDGDDIYGIEDTLLAGRGPEANAIEPTSSLEADAGPSAPSPEQISAGWPADDKQELERQRLLHEASSPPDFPDDMRGDCPGPRERRSDGRETEPSAPMLDEVGDDGDLGHPDGPGAEQLPAYER